MFELKDMTDHDLKTLIDAAYAEIHSRDNKRFKELVQNVCDAINTLRAEFPYAQLWIEDDDDLQDINILDRARTFEPSMFSR